MRELAWRVLIILASFALVTAVGAAVGYAANLLIVRSLEW